MDFEVGDREGKALRPDVRPMREARDFLFCIRPEAKPPQHANELVAKSVFAVVFVLVGKLVATSGNAPSRRRENKAFADVNPRRNNT